MNEERNMLPRAIVVRKRTLNETRDLALRVVGKNFKTLLAYYWTLALPVWILDVMLLCTIDRVLDDELSRYGMFFLTWILVLLQSGFVGTLVTQYLGIWLFRDPSSRIESREVVSAWKKQLPQLLYYLVWTRLFRTRFFYAEAILLERTPRRNTPEQTSTFKRVRNINKHCRIRLDFVLTQFYLFSGVLSGYALLSMLVGAAIPEREPALFLVDYILAPAFILGCELYSVAFKFFSYINFRIVKEGWDLDLVFTEELNKLIKNHDDRETRSNRGQWGKKLASLTLELDAERGETETRP